MKVKRSFLLCFSIVYRFVFGKSFLKMTQSFWTFRKRITIVFENYRFYQNDLRPFFIRLFLKTIAFEKTIVFQKRKIIVNFVNEGSSLTIVNETTNFIKKQSFLKKNYMQLYWMSPYMKLNSYSGSKTSWY